MPLVLDSLRSAVGALLAVQARSKDSALMARLDEVTREGKRSERASSTISSSPTS
jgi:hypothetical protein